MNFKWVSCGEMGKMTFCPLLLNKGKREATGKWIVTTSEYRLALAQVDLKESHVTQG